MDRAVTTTEGTFILWDTTPSPVSFLHPSGDVSKARLLVRTVALQTGAPNSLITSKRVTRAHDVDEARLRAVWVVAQRTSLSFPKIGRLFDRHHTTIIDMLKSFEVRHPSAQGMGRPLQTEAYQC